MTLHIEALLCETRAFVLIGYRRRRRNCRDCGKRASLRSGAEKTCDTVFTSRYVYRLKRSAITGEVFVGFEESVWERAENMGRISMSLPTSMTA
jgi:hypothetical protein